MNYEEVKELIAIVDTSTLTQFELNMDNVSLKMSKNGSAPEISAPKAPAQAEKPLSVPMVINEIAPKAPQKPQEDKSGELVKAPIVGTFYSAPGVDKPNFVKVGDHVKKGDVLCILEAMKIMNEINSPFDGEIAEVYVTNETLVEYGQPLFRIKA